MRKILFFIIFCTNISAFDLLEGVRDDFSNYFSKKNISFLLSGFVIGGIVANTTLDQRIQDFYQREIRTTTTDSNLRFWKQMGQDEVLIAYGSLGIFSLLTTKTAAGDFSIELLMRCKRAFIIGTIPLHITRTLTGGSRPSNTTRYSTWEPFTLPHGVSGHTYTGAILFITWAKLVDNLFFKSLLYGASILTGISRINDECHYPSQVFLGWLMGYSACQAVYLK